MALFDDLGSFISKTGETLSKKAQELSAPAVNSNNLRLAQRDLKNLYYELGRKYYLQKTGTAISESGLDDLIEKIHLKEAELKDLAQIAADTGKIACPSCGAKIAADSVFCPKCGSKIEKEEKKPNTSETNSAGVCPRCGNKLEDDMDFCTGCGLDLRSMRKAENTAVQVMDKDVSDAVAETDAVSEEVVSVSDASAEVVDKTPSIEDAN